MPQVDHRSIKFIPFYKRKVLQQYWQWMNCKVRGWKQKIHHTDTHTNTHTEIYSKSALYYTTPVMNICRERQSGNHLLIRLHAWTMGHPSPSTSLLQFPVDSQDTRPISHEMMLQDSGSYWCYRSCPVHLDQHHAKLRVFNSLVTKNMQKIPSQELARVHGMLIFILYMLIEELWFQSKVHSY